MIKCPKCGSTNVQTERRPDGDSQCGACGHKSDTRLFETELNDPAEVAFTKFLNKPTEFDDPYWQLFEIKDVMNTTILRAVEYGYKKGFEQAEREHSFYKIKWEAIKPFISKINGWANFKAFLEREIK